MGNPSDPSDTGNPGDTGDERLALDAARTLFGNGDDTIGVIAAVDRLNTALGRRFEVQCRWGEVRLTEHDRPLLVAAVVPAAVNMRRVGAVLAAVDVLPAEPFVPGAPERETLRARLAAAATIPAYDIWLFTLACAVGVFGLTYLNGARGPVVPLIVAATAAVSAFARRGLARLGVNVLAQLLVVTVLAGVVGSVVTQLGVGYASGLAALGPLLILVPGPSLLGGLFDLAGLRLSIGLSRLAFGVICLAVLSAGVVIGAALAGGVTPDPFAPEATLPWWADMLGAAAASAGYAIFFVIPLRLLVLPVVFGALAHGLRWVAINQWGFELAPAVGIACLFVGVAVQPVVRRWRLPFAAFGFAAVVAQVPGSYLFRMSGGLVALLHPGRTPSTALLGQIAVDGGTAVLTLAAMGLGLVVPTAIARRIRPGRFAG